MEVKYISPALTAPCSPRLMRRAVYLPLTLDRKLAFQTRKPVSASRVPPSQPAPPDVLPDSALPPSHTKCLKQKALAVLPTSLPLPPPLSLKSLLRVICSASKTCLYSAPFSPPSLTKL